MVSTWWAQLHGLDVVGRVWRESRKPECPIKAYMRIFGLNEQTFADDYMRKERDSGTKTASM